MGTENAPSVGAITAAPDTMDDALDILGATQGSWAVLISPHRQHAESRRLVYQARAAYEETLVAFHVTRLSPLGVGALYEMAQPLMRVLPPHRVLPALAVLESQIRCLAVVPSVINMDEPKVGLWLHARSWIPGGTYIAELGDVVRGYSRRRPEKTFEHFDLAAEGSIAIVGESVQDKKSSKRVNDVLEGVLGHLEPQDIIRRPNPDPTWWGNSNGAQIVLAPSNLSRAARRAAEAEPVLDDVPVRALMTAAVPAISPSESRGSQEKDIKEAVR